MESTEDNLFRTRGNIMFILYFDIDIESKQESESKPIQIFQVSNHDFNKAFIFMSLAIRHSFIILILMYFKIFEQLQLSS
jgi:hypothetical protein